MAIVLNPIVNPDKLSLINSNFTKIAAAINESLVWRNGNTAGETSFTRDLDMNGYQILNAYVGEHSLSDVVEIANGASEAAQSAQESAENAAASAASAAQSAAEAGDKVSYTNLASTSDVAMGDALVGVKFPATGGVARTQHAKNFETVNVKDFGAVGDGVTDDAPAFQAALNYVISVDVGGGGYPNKLFGRKLYIPSGMYEIKSVVALTLNQTRFLTIEGESELSSQISVNNSDGFLNITCTGRTSTVEINRLGILAKWGTASTQPGVGRDDFPTTLADVHDVPSGTAVRITFPAGISTVKSKSLKMCDVIMTGWNRYRGDFFTQGIYLTGGRNPTLERVVIEGKYGMLLTGRPDELFSNGTAFRFIDSYSPTLEDCYTNHYVRGFDLTSASSDPSFSTSEGGVIVRSAFDSMYSIRLSLPGGEPQFNISNSHLNYTRIGIEFSGKNQVHVKDNLFYCEASVAGTVARDIVMRGTQKSQITGNIFGKTNTGDRYVVSLYKQPTVNIPVTSLVINNNLYWAGGTGTFRNFSLAGSGSASNVTIGDGECFEGSPANLFTLGGSDHAAINPMRFCGDVAPEGAVWAPMGSLYTLRATGVLYKKGGTLTSTTGWTAVA